MIRFEDWTRELVTLSDASFVTIDPQEVVSEEGSVVSGATQHKLESAKMVFLGEVEGVASTMSTALSWTEWQAIRWIPDRDDPTKTIWGVIKKQTVRYGADLRDNKIELSVIQDPGHAFFHSRPVTLDGDPVSGVGVNADDYMKDLVAQAFTGSTPESTSMAWDYGGDLAIESDNSEADALTDLDEFSGWLDDVLDAIGEQYDVDWELLPSVSGSTITWTFNTKHPRGGTDRTSGAGRTVIDDFAGAAPKGERFLDKSQLRNEWVLKDGSASSRDTDSQSAWGLWLGMTDADTADGRAVDLALSALKEGSEWSWEDALAGTQWMTDFDAGDLVIKANSRTNEAETNGKIEAVSWSWDNGIILRPDLRWGDKKPTYTSKRSGGGGGGGGGGTKRNPAEPEDSDGGLAKLHNLLGDRHEDTDPASPSDGDIIIGTGDPVVWTVLAAADEDDVLTIVSGVPAWAANSGGVTDHGELDGLSDDDHTQYLLASGSRSLSGAWNAAQAITAPYFNITATEYMTAASSNLQLTAAGNINLGAGGQLNIGSNARLTTGYSITLDGGGIVMSAGYTVDGIDVSAHKHSLSDHTHYVYKVAGDTGGPSNNATGSPYNP